MPATEREDSFEVRLERIYADQVSGLRSQLQAVDRNVMTYIAEGRERGKQIETLITQLGRCAVELEAIGHEKWIIRTSLLLLMLAVGALLIKVF